MEPTRFDSFGERLPAFVAGANEQAVSRWMLRGGIALFWTLIVVVVAARIVFFDPDPAATLEKSAASLAQSSLDAGSRIPLHAVPPVIASARSVASGSTIPTWHLHARVIAVGLPGVAGVREVGRFHSGGPIPGNPEFLMSTATGRVLDPERVMVAIASNLGAPLGNPGHAAGAILSIDPRGGPNGSMLVIPKTFPASGRSEALGDAVLVYTTQSSSFQNRRYNRGARTADFAAASGPRYLSMNNAFGRPWIANAPHGLHGAGSVTVVDPDGRPLDNAPSDLAGGVFAGRTTDREWIPMAQPGNFVARALNYRASRQLTPGSLTSGALGTAFLGPSPDGSGFAVFAVVTGDGAVVQAHVQDGLDGLAPPGTIGQVQDGGGVIGIAFKWNPDRVLYVADPLHNRLVLLHLDDDRRHFKVRRMTEIASAELKQPVDLAAALPEIANPGFASHTTFAGLSDLYVANRGDGSLLRLRQDGRVLARARIDVPGLGQLDHGRIRGIAVSADAQRIFLTLQGELADHPGHEGVLIEVSAFDSNGAHSGGDAPRAGTATSDRGEQAFREEYTPSTGLGPLFNARSCIECHPGPGGMSSRDEHFVRRVARMDAVTGRVASVEHPNSPVSRRHSTRDFGDRAAPAAELPRQANVVSLRMPLALHASALLDEIPDIEIAAQAVSKGDGIKGRVHYVTGMNGEQRAGRYGWKAHVATLEEMVAEAFANEIGITSPLAPSTSSAPPKDDGELVRAVAAYLRELRVPPRGNPQ